VDRAAASTPRAGVRAWLRRPDVVRVETLDGDLLQVVRERPVHAALLTSDADDPMIYRPSLPTPALDDDGLVHAHRDRDSRTGYDAPMFGSYQWVAVLDPVELADGDDHGWSDDRDLDVVAAGDATAGLFGTTVGDVALVDHHGRDALAATVVPTTGYAPRCDCCALLHSEISDRRLADGGVDWSHPHGFAYADSFRVRLDVQTGVCVQLEQVGGSEPGVHMEVDIEAVDVDMPDQLFPESRPRRGWRR
jgi:hypothetical protein